jgi:hypothetical protein
LLVLFDLRLVDLWLRKGVSIVDFAQGSPPWFGWSRCRGRLDGFSSDRERSQASLTTGVSGAIKLTPFPLSDSVMRIQDVT